MLRKALLINFNILKVVVDLKLKAVGAELSLLLYCNCAVAEGVSVSESFTVHKWCPPLKNTIPLHDPLLVSLLLILNHMMLVYRLLLQSIFLNFSHFLLSPFFLSVFTTILSGSLEISLL